MADADLMRRVALESLRAATQSLDARTAEETARAIGRRVGEALAGRLAAADAARELALDGRADGLPSEVTEGLARGLAGALEAARPPAPARPTPPWTSTREARDLVAATRRAMHDLNQPLTVILGYAAILKRADAESVRLEAAEQIVKEARKMNEIIGGLSRLARGLDAA
ncbi:MAG TPA: histidine kinase dimerization/phospho-acceptor domain-containing protein [Thermodesulfobacteriota bacterium]